METVRINIDELETMDSWVFVDQSPAPQVHADPTCSAFEGAPAAPVRWSERSKTWACAVCIHVDIIPAHSGTEEQWSALLSNSVSMAEIAWGGQEEEEEDDAPTAPTKGKRKARKNDASPAQLDFITRLLEQKGFAGQDPVDILFTKIEQKRHRRGILSKKEASELINLLRREEDTQVAAPEVAEGFDAPAVKNFLDSLGRKVTFDDLEDLDAGLIAGLEGFAFEWAKTQTGASFNYIRDIAAKANAGHWQPSMTKGVLNTWAAGVRRGDITVGSDVKATSAPVVERSYAGAPEGIHQLGDVVYKVQLNLAGTRTYAKELLVSGEGDDAVGLWDYVGRVNGLDDSTLLSLEEAKAFGQLYGVCCNCGRRLTDETSIAEGIGPVCAKRWSTS